MEKGKIVKGNNLLHFITTYQGYTLWSYDEETSFETEVSINKVDSSKWYYISRNGKSQDLYLVEIDFIGSDGELRSFLQ